MLALVGLALVLRLWELGDRAMHHDESLDAWWSWLFRNGRYERYDPVYHGPLRFYVTAGFYELFGESDAVARLFSALCGTAVVGLPWFLRRELGRAGTITAAAALTISPTMLYYSRFGREDAQMVFLTLLALVLGLSYLRRPRIATAAGLAFTLACSFAIKESTYLFGLLLAVYLVVLLAAQFDAQHRVDLGIESDPDRLDPAFMNTSLLLAAAGLLAAVVIGAASDELFLVIGLYGLALAAFGFVTALPRLRSARLEWSRVRAGTALAAVGAIAISLLLLRSGSGGDGTEPVATGPDWDVNLIMLLIGALIATAALLVLLADDLGASLPERLQHPHARAYAGAFTVAGLALMANEYAEAEDRRIIALVAIMVLAGASALLTTALPRATAPDHRWPSMLRSVGAIGWFGWLVTLAVFVISWFLFFTVWGRVKHDWASGFTRAVEYWDSQQEVNRGGQPWYYYLYALPAYEWAFVALGFVGGWRALRRPTMLSTLLVWFTLGSLILYSYAGERMPWLIAHPLLPILILAGMGAQQLWEHRDHRVMPAIATICALALLATAATSIRASFPNGADSRELLSQAGQATPHVNAALARLENIDSIAMRETGEPAKLAIGTANAWPYSWYLRDRANVTWFTNETGPPTDGSVDVIIVDKDIIDPAAFADYQSTLFAMRSWWVPTYTDAGPRAWLSYLRGRTLWEQNPNPNFVGVNEVEPAEAEGGLAATLGRIKDGANARSRAWVGFTAADAAAAVDPVDPNAFVEPDDGRDGCGSVDQWFLVHNRFAFTEGVVYPEPIAEMGPLACASDLLATS